MEITKDNIKEHLEDAFLLLGSFDFDGASLLFESVISEKEVFGTLPFSEQCVSREGYGIALLNNEGRQEEALEIIHDVYRELSKYYGKNHPDTIAALHSLGCAYRTCGKKSEACGIFAYEVALLQDDEGRMEERDKAEEAYLEIIHSM